MARPRGARPDSLTLSSTFRPTKRQVKPSSLVYKQVCFSSHSSLVQHSGHCQIQPRARFPYQATVFYPVTRNPTKNDPLLLPAAKRRRRRPPLCRTMANSISPVTMPTNHHHLLETQPIRNSRVSLRRKMSTHKKKKTGADLSHKLNKQVVLNRREVVGGASGYLAVAPLLELGGKKKCGLSMVGEVRGCWCVVRRWMTEKGVSGREKNLIGLRRELRGGGIERGRRE